MTLIREMQYSKLEKKGKKCGVWLLLLKRGSCLCQTTREQINQKGASRFRHFVWERCCFFPILKSKSDLISQQRSCMWHKSLERSMIPMPLCLGPLFCIWCHYVCLFCFVAGYHCTTTGPHQTHLLINIDFSDCATIEWNHRRLSF